MIKIRMIEGNQNYHTLYYHISVSILKSYEKFRKIICEYKIIWGPSVHIKSLIILVRSTLIK